MQVDYPYIPLVRINAPEIFADPEFKEWFFNRPKGCKSAKYAPAIATWHQPQETKFGEFSNFFTTVDGGGCGDHADGDDSESDMPPQIWKQLVTAAWEALDRPAHFECLLGVSNLCDYAQDRAGRGGRAAQRTLCRTGGGRPRSPGQPVQRGRLSGFADRHVRLPVGLS